MGLFRTRAEEEKLEKAILALSNKKKNEMGQEGFMVHIDDVADVVIQHGRFAMVGDGHIHDSPEFSEEARRFLVELLWSLGDGEEIRVYPRKSRHSCAYFSFVRKPGEFFEETSKDEYIERNPDCVYLYPGIREDARKLAGIPEGELYQTLFNDVARKLATPTGD